MNVLMCACTGMIVLLHVLGLRKVMAAQAHGFLSCSPAAQFCSMTSSSAMKIVSGHRERQRML